jgi:hypothetical protein
VYYWCTKYCRCFLWWLSLLLLGACASDAPVLPKQDKEPAQGARAVYIANEGNFQWGNATISVYFPDEKLMHHDWFEQQNQRPIGDVLQSLTMIEGRIWAVLNNSGKIEIIDKATGKSTHTIEGLTSPRYLVQVGGHVLVSDLYDNAISIVDINSMSISKRVSMPSWTEEMEFTADRIFICMPHNEHVYVLNTDLDIEDSIYLGVGSHASALDKEGMLWVAAAGDSERDEEAALFKIDPNTLAVLSSVPLPNTTGLSARLIANNTGDTLWLLHQDVYRILPSSEPNPSVMINGTGKAFYGIGLDPHNSDLYVSDAVDFVSKGELLIFDAQMKAKHQADLGFIPSAFLFE